MISSNLLNNHTNSYDDNINQDIVNTAIKWFPKPNYMTCQINLVGRKTMS